MAKPIKARVIVAFTDKNDMSTVYSVGDTFEGTTERVNELIISGHVEPLDNPRKTKEQ